MEVLSTLLVSTQRLRARLALAQTDATEKLWGARVGRGGVGGGGGGVVEGWVGWLREGLDVWKWKFM